MLTILLMFFSVNLAGCVTFTDFESSQEYTSDPVGKLDAQTSLGQSFVSRRPRFNGITIWVTTASVQEGSQDKTTSNLITAKLFHSAKEASPIFSTTILAPSSGDNLPVYINISDQNNNSGQSFYIELIKDSGTVQINGRNEDAYPYGQAFVNGAAIDADIAFRLSYDYGFQAFLQDIKQNLSSLWLVFPLLVLLWLPGWLMIEFSGLRHQFDFGGQTGMSVGLSVAFIPLLMLWTTILKIRWTRSSALFFAGILVLLLIVRLIYKYFSTIKKGHDQGFDESIEPIDQAKNRRLIASGCSIGLTLIFLFTVTLRLIMVRDLATPAWVDSVHHTLITRMIISAGAYPSSYLPFWDFAPTAYHPGFHSIAAMFTWLTDLNLERSLLILGQVLNALMIFPVYLMAKSLTSRSSIGLIAALITGFITPMPAYYTSWGRYTELAGLLILPAAFVLVQILIDRQAIQRKYLVILTGGIVTGGLFLVHYRVILFLGCLVVSYLGVYLLPKNKQPSTGRARALVDVFILAASGILLVSPWLYQTLKGTVLPWISANISAQVTFFQDFSWAYLTSALGKQSLIFAGLGLLWGVIRRLRFAFLLLLWVALLFFFANLAALHLPGGSLVNNTSVEIMLFMPISIFGAYFLDEIITSWSTLLPKILAAAFIGLMIVVLGFFAYAGARQLITIINPVTILSRHDDIAAIEWIKDNIPENETVVINPFAWGYGLYAGNDGGYWISPLSGRLTLPPPVLYGLSSDSVKINQQSQQVTDLSSDPAAFKDFLDSSGLHYVYIGARGGVISPQKLSDSGSFTTLYHEGGVWIFSAKP